MQKICSYFGVSKSGYYKRLKTLPAKESFEQEVLTKVSQIRAAHPFYGLRKLYHQLHRDGFSIGRDHLWHILQKHRLMITPKRNKFRTTFSGNNIFDAKNLIRDLEISRTNQVWVTDITYLLTLDGVLYLSTIMDLYSRKIISYSLGIDLTAESSVKCLKKAVKSVKQTNGIIHHSDKGSQYRSKLYCDTLRVKGITPSYTGKDHCYENANMERFYHTLKYDYKLKLLIKSKTLAYSLVNNAIEDYNNNRLHAAINYRTPSEMYNAA